IIKYDDSLDAFGVHGVGGFLGAVLTGVFCYEAVNPAVKVGDEVVSGGANGLLTGHPGQVVMQLVAAVAAAVFAMLASLILVKVLDVTCGLVADAKGETEGLDRTEHGEVGFDLGPALEVAPERAIQEPRPATVPPNGQKRFTVVVEGPR